MKSAEFFELKHWVKDLLKKALAKRTELVEIARCTGASGTAINITTDVSEYRLFLLASTNSDFSQVLATTLAPKGFSNGLRTTWYINSTTWADATYIANDNKLIVEGNTKRGAILYGVK